MAIRTLFNRSSAAVLVGLIATLGAAAPTAAHASSNRADRGTSTVARATGPRPDMASSSCIGRTLPLNCWVIEPIVNQASAAYPAIQFFPGDHVTVDAGGCVQTGGHGLTWKRYVDPASDNGLYHGSISIPGAINGLRQLWSVVGTTFVVGGNGGTLVLGYQDDGYSDNGYYAHDNGTGDQCKNVGNAWVHIVIS
jgi:hypothetical protein